MQDESGGDIPEQQPTRTYDTKFTQIFCLSIGLASGLMIYDIIRVIMSIVMQVMFALMGVGA